jgi:tetratricopeptide (TPR) repeat protein
MSNKETDTLLSPEENERVQHLFSQYHQIADLLRTSLDAEQAQAALVVVADLTEAAQNLFVKSLAKENEQDAADILAGINAFSQFKEVRKAARRGLLRLESSKIRPQWKPPVKQVSAVQVTISNPPRFWKGFVTQTREEGEMQLLLGWEQGFEYNEIRLFSFLLDYWNNGIKDFFDETGTKRHTNERINTLRSNLPNNSLVECSLAEGKRLIEEALSVNEWRNLPPVQEYRNQLPLLNKLIFQATDLGEDRGRTFVTPDLETQEVVVNFLGAWTFGDFGLAYHLLTDDCDIRDNLSHSEWVSQRRQWHQEAKPLRMELSFVHDLPPRQSALWLPSSVSKTAAIQKKEVEVGWSVEMLDTPLSGILKEMPFRTALNKETSRSWFWTSYALVRVDNAWRIQKQTDEGLSLQATTIDDLQKRIKENEDVLEKLVQQQRHTPDAQKFLEEASWRLSQMLHCYDALIARLPLDYEINEQAYSSAVLTGNPERMMVYLERMIERFPQNRVNNLQRLGATMVGLAERYNERNMAERADQLLKRAEETLREAISINDDAAGHMLLGELLINANRNAEAEAELLLAKERTHTEEIEASIEAGLGNIAMRTERLAKAITHFEYVSKLNPQYPDVWFSLGFAHRLSGQMNEAEQIYRHAIEIDPHDPRLYGELTAIYMAHEEPDKAISLLENGLRIAPNSAILHALLASTLFANGNQREAQRHLEAAENINPELEIVRDVKLQISNQQKKS